MKVNLTTWAIFALAFTFVSILMPRAVVAKGGGTGPALTPEAEAGLLTALAGPSGEYAARAEYAAIIEFFGPVQPYVNILASEEKHVAALEQQCVKFGVTIPDDPYWDQITPPSNLLEAALTGVLGEELNIAMYDELLPYVLDYPSLFNVFTTLQAASLENHLPAFEAAVLKEQP